MTTRPATGALRDFCLDADDHDLVGHFWASAFGADVAVYDDGAKVTSDHFPAMWVLHVPEPKSVKNRVHLDVYGHGPDAAGRLLDLGASIEADRGDFLVLRDPEGAEFCLFPDRQPAAATAAPARPFALCVDSRRPVELAAWWQGILGGEIVDGPDGTPRYVEGCRGFSGMTLKFVPVDDERVVKNRFHWDVNVGDDAGIRVLLDAGATVVRQRDDEIRWTVMTDPDGNEFCAFAE